MGLVACHTALAGVARRPDIVQETRGKGQNYNRQTRLSLLTFHLSPLISHADT